MEAIIPNARTLTLACVLAVSGFGAALPDQTPISSAAVDWQTKAREDLAGYAAAARETYIYAAYPDAARWRRQFDATLKDVDAKLPLVHDAAGYQAILKYLSVTFHDAHVGIQFTHTLPTAEWPGFLARFDNGSYRVADSQVADLADGAAVTACDGRPVEQWIKTINRFEIGLPVALETTRNLSALHLFVDRSSPLRSRPTHCTIGGREVALDWVQISSGNLGAALEKTQGERADEASTRSVGSDGAWVRLGYFEPTNAKQAAAFHTAMDVAPSLRNKRFIILDVRGNGGGPYNWFMGYLRALYGQAYADYYATARLHIRAVHRLSDAAARNDAHDEAAASNFKRPPDPPYAINDARNDEIAKEASAAHEPYFRVAPLSIERGVAPPDPVKAHVYVLTDYRCASACIGFVDELKLFPGVKQIGLPTYIDSRSGTPGFVVLPSGESTAFIATMTRDGRVRGDNEPQIPSIRFNGDIRDNDAVEAWVTHDVVGRNE